MLTSSFCATVVVDNAAGPWVLMFMSDDADLSAAGETELGFKIDYQVFSDEGCTIPL